MSKTKKMKIAIMGIRGIPANYGGFETFAEELSTRLVKKGHNVSVYGRANIVKYKEIVYKGVNIITLPTISNKYFDTVFHTFLCVLHSLVYRYDIVLICNAANAIFCFLAKFTGTKVVINVDGIERKRQKWNWLGKIWYIMGEIFSCIFPNKIVTDAKVMESYYLERYRKKSVMIPYGYSFHKQDSQDVLEKFQIKPKEYILYVSRFEPENNAHILIEAFKKVKTNKNLVIVGDAPYSNQYKEYLRQISKGDKRIIFTGYIFGKSYRELQSHCYCYVHATEVGGTHPALIEAMGFGNCVIVNETPENIEVVNNNGIIYKKNDIIDLKEKLEFILSNPDVISNYSKIAQERVKLNYSWETIVNKYENLFMNLLKK